MCHNSSKCTHLYHINFYLYSIWPTNHTGHLLTQTIRKQIMHVILKCPSKFSGNRFSYLLILLLEEGVNRWIHAFLEGDAWLGMWPIICENINTCRLTSNRSSSASSVSSTLCKTKPYDWPTFFLSPPSSLVCRDLGGGRCARTLARRVGKITGIHGENCVKIILLQNITLHVTQQNAQSDTFNTSLFMQ